VHLALNCISCDIILFLTNILLPCLGELFEE
jgi:hypothetical protein